MTLRGFFVEQSKFISPYEAERIHLASMSTDNASELITLNSISTVHHAERHGTSLGCNFQVSVVTLFFYSKVAAGFWKLLKQQNKLIMVNSQGTSWPQSRINGQRFKALNANLCRKANKQTTFNLHTLFDLRYWETVATISLISSPVVCIDKWIKFSSIPFLLLLNCKQKIRKVKKKIEQSRFVPKLNVEMDLWVTIKLMKLLTKAKTRLGDCKFKKNHF